MCDRVLGLHITGVTVEESFVIFVTFSPRAPVSSTVWLPPLCHTHPLHPATIFFLTGRRATLWLFK